MRDHGGAEGEPLFELKTQIDVMRTRKASYEQILNRMEVTNRQQGTDAVKVALVREDLASLRGMKESVQRRIEQLHFDSRGEARIRQIDPARKSGMLTKDRRRNLWAATPVGVLALVLGLFLLLEIRSGRVADLDEVSRRVPVEVYSVPSLPGARRTSDHRVLRSSETQLQEFLQSLDHLRVSLWYGKEAAGGSGRSLIITSAVGGEGKTTLAAHLAVCCAKAGISTLVIDADLRRAALSRMFEEERAAGLSDVLKGDMAPEEAVIALRDGGFHLLPAGSPGQHPGWLFREQRIGQVLTRYRQMFDMVILDTPPVLPVADALSLSHWVDGAVLVIRYEISRFPLVDRARRRLISAGIPVLKTVVNGVKASRFGSGYGYNYGYSYGDTQRTSPTDVEKAVVP
jgi:capsular exopolysaccharide synthesis family protein